VFLTACLGTLGILRASVYSASAFVRAYLGAVQSHDLSAALRFPGVRLSDEDLARLVASDPGQAPRVSKELLRGDVLGTMRDLRIVAQKTDADHVHHITAAFTLSPTGAGDPRAFQTTFTVVKAAPIAGVLPRWRFSVSPLAVARIEVRHTHTFTLARHTLDVRAATGRSSQLFSGIGDYLVMTPSSMMLGHDDALTTAVPARLDITTPGTVSQASLTARPSGEFTERVQDQVNNYLDGCAKQKVLQPTGCPIGKRIDNRVLGEPGWRITRYPTVSIAPGTRGWMMPTAAGHAELSVRVQSLFDGSITVEHDSVPFEISISQITIGPEGSLTISVAG
jgi:hypothetical protein